MIGAIPQSVAVLLPVLIIVAKAVAGTPICTERLLGSTEATNGDVSLNGLILRIM